MSARSKWLLSLFYKAHASGRGHSPKRQAARQIRWCSLIRSKLGRVSSLRRNLAPIAIDGMAGLSLDQ